MKNTIKYTVTPKDENEAKRIAKYLKSGKFQFTVRGEGVSKKSETLVELEQTFAKMAGTKRFRFTAEERDAVKAGEITRENVIRKRIKALSKEQAAD